MDDPPNFTDSSPANSTLLGTGNISSSIGLLPWDEDTAAAWGNTSRAEGDITGLGNQWSVSVLFRTGTENRIMWCFGTPEDLVPLPWQCLTNTSGDLQFRPGPSGTGGTTRQSPGTRPPGFADNVTHHGVVTCDGTSAIAYCDGVAATPVTTSTQPQLATAISSLTTKFTLGRGGTSFAGVLDEVAIFNRALTPQEILGDYEAINDQSSSGGDVGYALSMWNGEGWKDLAGGGAGSQGPQGSPGLVEVHEQAQQPDTQNAGALWITEEQLQPSPGGASVAGLPGATPLVDGRWYVPENIGAGPHVAVTLPSGWFRFAFLTAGRTCTITGMTIGLEEAVDSGVTGHLAIYVLDRQTGIISHRATAASTVPSGTPAGLYQMGINCPVEVGEVLVPVIGAVGGTMRVVADNFNWDGIRDYNLLGAVPTRQFLFGLNGMFGMNPNGTRDHGRWVTPAIQFNGTWGASYNLLTTQEDWLEGDRPRIAIATGVTVP